MKRLALFLAVVMAVMTLSVALTACSGNTPATEAPTEAPTAAPTEAVSKPDVVVQDEPDGSQYLPLTTDNVLDYVKAVYGYDYFDMDGITVGNGKENTVYIRFEMNGKYYYYRFNKDTGEAVEEDEDADAPTEAPTEVTQRAIDVCNNMLPGFVAHSSDWPDNIVVRRFKDENTGKQMVQVNCDWEGEAYEFIYDVEADTATQVKP